MQENDKMMKKVKKKIGKNAIFNKEIIERSSEGLSNYPRCML